jgi:hypothetical protein
MTKTTNASTGSIDNGKDDSIALQGDHGSPSLSHTTTVSATTVPPRVILLRHDPVPYAQLFIRYNEDGSSPEVFATMIQKACSSMSDDPFIDKTIPADQQREAPEAVDGKEFWDKWAPSPNGIEESNLYVDSSTGSDNSSRRSGTSKSDQGSLQRQGLSDGSVDARYDLIWPDHHDLVTQWADPNVWLLGENASVRHNVRNKGTERSMCGNWLVRSRAGLPKIPRRTQENASLAQSKPKGPGLKLRYSNLP